MSIAFATHAVPFIRIGKSKGWWACAETGSVTGTTPITAVAAMIETADDLAKSTSGPNLVTNTINGYAVADHKHTDGSTRFLQSTTYAGSAPLSVFVVGRIEAATSTLLSIGRRDAITSNLHFGLDVNRKMALDSVSQAGVFVNLATGTAAYSLSAGHVWGFTLAGSGGSDAYAFYGDGSADGSGTTTAMATSVAQDYTQGAVGTTAGGWGVSDCMIAEVLTFTHVLSAIELTEIHNYLRTKYNI